MGVPSAVQSVQSRQTEDCFYRVERIIDCRVEEQFLVKRMAFGILPEQRRWRPPAHQFGNTYPKPVGEPLKESNLDEERLVDRPGGEGCDRRERDRTLKNR